MATYRSITDQHRAMSYCGSFPGTVGRIIYVSNVGCFGQMMARRHQNVTKHCRLKFMIHTPDRHTGE